MNLFTPEDLLAYYYQETSPEKTTAIANALESNWALQQKFDIIKQAALRLEKAVRSPRTESMQAIMEYAIARAPQAVK